MATDDSRISPSALLPYLAVLWHIRHVGEMGAVVLVRPGYSDKPGRSYAVWSISDNGGELQVDRVNIDHEPGVPYTAWSSKLNLCTMAYRIAMRILGEPIEWDLRLDDGLLKECSVSSV